MCHCSTWSLTAVPCWVLSYVVAGIWLHVSPSWPTLEPRETKGWGGHPWIFSSAVGNEGPVLPFPGSLPLMIGHVVSSEFALWFPWGSSHNIFFPPGSSPCPEPRCTLDGYRSPASLTDMALCFSSQERLYSWGPPGASLWNRSVWLPGWPIRYLPSSSSCMPQIPK